MHINETSAWMTTHLLFSKASQSTVTPCLPCLSPSAPVDVRCSGPRGIYVAVQMLMPSTLLVIMKNSMPFKCQSSLWGEAQDLKYSVFFDVRIVSVCFLKSHPYKRNKGVQVLLSFVSFVFMPFSLFFVSFPLFSGLCW